MLDALWIELTGKNAQNALAALPPQCRIHFAQACSAGYLDHTISMEQSCLCLREICLKCTLLKPGACLRVHRQLFSLQILFISGLSLVIGLERTFRFFFQQHKLKGTAAFMGGILVVLVGWPLVGMIIETYGFILLFG